MCHSQWWHYKLLVMEARRRKMPNIRRIPKQKLKSVGADPVTLADGHCFIVGTWLDGKVPKALLLRLELDSIV